MALLFLVSADLNEHQRERLISTLTQQGIVLEQYTTIKLEDTFRDLFASAKTGFADPFVTRGGRDHNKRSYIILDHGECDGNTGYWVQDEDELHEGFYDVTAQVYWGYDEDADAWFSRKGGRLKRGKFKPRKGGKKGGKGRSRGNFK